ncbi:transposase [Bacillus tianshenii]|nr:transposase [Bacillus tianshenii]
MKKAFKTEIKPTEQQRINIHHTIGVCRFLYNLFLAYNKEIYEQFKSGTKEYGYVSGNDFDKYVNNELSAQEGYEWIKQAGSKARKKAIMNAHTAFKRFFKGQSKFPRFKKKKNQDVKAYFPKNNQTDWTVERHRIKIPTFGWVRLKEFGYIPSHAKVISGTVSQKAGRYYVSVLCEMKQVPKVESLTSKGLGIDVGIKTFATTSDETTYKNINKTIRVKKLEKRLRREQRSLSRKYEALKKQTKGGETAAKKRANLDKNLFRVQKLHARLSNIRNEYVKSVVNECVKTKPRYITIEDLNVNGMMKNRHLSKAVAQQCFYYFKTLLTRKCNQHGIELRQVNRWYPSSKLCSCCGQKKKDLQLKDRTYTCGCGNTMDRDLNASVNLAQATEYIVLT